MSTSLAVPRRWEVDTASGRTVRVGALAMRGLPVAGRVTLAVDCAPFDDDGVWLSLTRQQAYRLATALLDEARRL